MSVRPFLIALLTTAIACSGADASVDAASDENDVTAARACAPTVPRSKPIELSVWPDAGEAAVVKDLAAAKKSIRLMVYMLGEDGVFSTLKERAQAGIDVKVILDGGAQKQFNQHAFDGLRAAGVDVQWSDPKFSFMHAKSFVVDDKIAVISTGNFPLGLIQHERNYVARDTDKADVKSLASVFDADFSHTDPDLSCTRLLVSPINAKDRILEVINGATRSLLVESLELADGDVVSAIIAQKKAGRDVRVVLADPAKMADNTDAARKLAREHVPVKFIPKQRFLVHVKNIIVDGTHAYMGSENMTTTSLTRNREVGLVVTDKPAIDTMTTTFEADFASAKNF